jgi:hypothetical protein
MVYSNFDDQAIKEAEIDSPAQLAAVIPNPGGMPSELFVRQSARVSMIDS